MILPEASATSVMRFVLSVFSESRARVAVLLGLHSLARAAAALSPWALGMMIDSLIDDRGDTLLWQLVLILVGSAIVASVLAGAAHGASYAFGARVFTRVRSEFVDGLLALPATTVEQAGTGDIASRATNDMDAIEEASRDALPDIVLGIVSIAITLVAAFVVAGPLAFTLLSGVPILLVGTIWYVRRSPRAYRHQLRANATLTQVLLETSSQTQTIKYLGLGPERRTAFQSAVKNYRVKARAALRLILGWFPVAQLGYQLPPVVVILTGLLLDGGGRGSVGTVASLVFYSQQLVDPLDDLVYWANELVLGGQAAKRILGVRTVPDPISHDEVGPGDEICAAASGSGIEVRDAGVTFDDGRTGLHPVTLDLVPGERVVLWGPSGSGKTTFGELVAGVFRPTAGAVYFDGQPTYAHTDQESRRASIVVPQHPYMFSMSIRDNLLLGVGERTGDEIDAVLDLVGLLNWVQDLPEGIDTVADDSDTEVTPGQAQRIALARAVLAQPAIAFLDECTSEVPPESSAQLERAVLDALPNTIVVLASHRFTSLPLGQRILIFEGGRIIDDGPPSDVITRRADLSQLRHENQSEIQRDI